MESYHSMRGKPFSKEITKRFWNGFKACIQEIVHDGLLSQYMGGSDYNFSEEFWYVNEDMVNLKMLQELGRPLYPLKDIPEDKEVVFDLIEFFYRFVSAPINNGYNVAKGRYDYTCRINRLFDNFNLSYRVIKGKVSDRHSGLMDNIILEEDFHINDPETQKLINLAIEKFYDRDFQEQKIGFEKLVDAYQRLTSLNGKDKKQNIKNILDQTCTEEVVKGILDNDLKYMHDIVNNKLMVRHTEVDKKSINDKETLEYLFFRYYNSIRFILKKYEKTNEEQCAVTDNLLENNR